jgi:hypothetical protein
MVDIEFEAAAAKALARAVRSAADTLQSQAGARAQAVESALVEFV